MPSVSKLIRKRGSIKAQVTRMDKFCTEKGANATIEELTTRMEQFKLRYQEFVDIEDQIMEADDAETESSELEQFEEQFYAVVAELQRLINIKAMAAVKAASIIEHSEVKHTEFKLPKTSVTKFDGKYKNWPAFSDVFCKVIDSNNSLSSSQKLQYLNELLQPEPQSVISSFPLTDSNYTEAWNKLEERYNRPKFIINAFIQEFMDQPAVKVPDAAQLRKIIDNGDSVVRNLKSLGNYAESRDPWLIFMLLKRVDEQTQQLWAVESASNTEPTFQEFVEFLNNRVEGLMGFQFCTAPLAESSARKQPAVRNLHINNEKCQVCGTGSHPLSSCEKFVDSDISNRRRLVKDNRFCYNCLRLGHGVFKCRAKTSCTKCKHRHHEMLHVDQPAEASKNQVSVNTVYQDRETSPQHRQVKLAILPTALVNVIDGHGNMQTCCALLDSGSEMSFITESCAQKLQLQRSNARMVVTGMGGIPSGTTRGEVQLQLSSRIDPSLVINLSALIMIKVTSQLPSSQFEFDKWRHIKGLELADPNFNVPGVADILIGADKFFTVLRPEQVKIDNMGWIAQNTMFGWIITGQLQDTSHIEETNSLHAHVVDIDRTLRNFWETEEAPIQRTLTNEELECQNHFEGNWHRDNDGRFVVRLPFKLSHPVIFGNTQSVAERRLYQMEKRLQGNSEFRRHYIQFMREYEALNHMEKVEPLDSDDSHGFYLPHHGVVKATSSTTKMRVVFDASAKSSTGRSLNDELLIGPTIQQNLWSILFRFRLYKVVFTADVEKMYRQVWVDNQDTNYQRILWRENDTDPIKHYRLKTITYGMSCSPYLATRVLNQIAIEEGGEYVNAATIIGRDFYVDDLMSGSEDSSSAINVIQEIREILLKGGFSLRKFSSNVEEVLNSVPEVDREIKSINLIETSKVKVLGINWNPSEDEFSLLVNLDNNSLSMKRGLLSDASRLFDPVGWLAPVIIRIKVLFQQLWLQNLTWDDLLPNTIEEEWRLLRNDLKSLEMLRIPRWVDTVKDNVLEIHGFSDASETAYAAAIYIRTRTEKGWHCHLLTSKTRVTPIKQVTIPRLELCGAVLLVKLWKTVSEAIQFENGTVLFWTDSTIVLNWLSSHPRRWKTYIANRTSEILQSTSRYQWHHVRSEDNPADLASRGVSSHQLINSSLWWHGPDWLQEDKELWPDEIIASVSNVPADEERVINVSANSYVLDSEYYIFNRLLQEENTFTAMRQQLAFVQLFVDSLKTSSTSSTTLSITEMQRAENQLLKWSQELSFGGELHLLQRGKTLLASSKILSFSPFLDDKGLLRVGGRLTKAEVNCDVKNPVILSGKCELARRIVKEHHLKGLHAGPTLLISNVRQRFWITNLRHLARSVVHMCVICFKHRQRASSQFMADLPQARVTLVRPFVKVGVDFAGPLTLRSIVGRGERQHKAYVSIFVCMSTKAVHIELVNDLSTEAFLAALRRFVSRRGLCTDIYSDNGTNFVGANNKLNAIREFLTEHSNELYFSLLKENIVWHFNPPAAPHFGGLWEAAVKSMKFHLYRVIGDTILKFEEMNTLLCQIEAMMNSRPLCGVHGDSDVTEVLTPSHFLIGHALTYLPERDLKEERISPAKRWSMIQKMVQHYWNRWHMEYLTTLQSRYKWKMKRPNLKIGDLVLVHEENVPPTKWPWGHVIQTYPGSDKMVRVVGIKTRTGIFKRPIHKLSVLPTIESDDSRRAECSGERQL